MTATRNFNSTTYGRLLRFIGLLALMTIALPGGMHLAQEQDEQAPPPALTVLEFRTYDSGWLRYRNSDEAGEPKLAIENVTEFPFRHVISETLLELDDLQNAETLAEQIEAIGEIDDGLLVYDEEEVDGICDTEKLSGSTDTLCVPGTSAMPDGLVFLALFHPETFELIALTTSIDNRALGATQADYSQATEQPTTQQPADPPVVENAPTGCGPYQVGQWILASEYDASGLNLTVREAGNCPVASYNCYQPDEGAPYLQAHCEGSGDDSAGDDDDNDDDDDDDGGLPAGELNCQETPEDPRC